jgi:hypothetical protein
VSAATFVEHHNENADRQLWCAVIGQAIQDATSARSNSRNSENGRLQSDKQAALDWLLNDSKDFVTVCTLAGVDPQSVRERVKQMPGVPEMFSQTSHDRTSPEPLSRSNMGFFQQ